MRRNMDYHNFFKLCGFTEDAIKEQSPRIDKTFQKLDITEEDVRRAEGRIQYYYDTNLEGVRKLLGVHVKEMINLVLAREENRKVIYCEWPGSASALLMSGIHTVDDVYFGTPASQTINVVMGCIFDKLGPIMEAGEESGLPAGAAHCALWQTHLGAIASGIIPKPDLIVSPGYLCDIPAETDQLLSEQYGIPVVYCDGCIDWQWEDWPDIPQHTVQYAARQLEKAKAKIEEVIGCKMSDDADTVGLTDVMKLYYNLQALVGLMGRADPQPTSQLNVDLAWWLIQSPMRHREEATQALLTLIKEVKQLIDEGKGILPKGTPRVYVAHRVAVDPSILRMMEDAGLALPVVCTDWLSPTQLQFQSTTPLEVVMEVLFKTGPSSSVGNVAFDIACCKTWNVDGAIITCPYSCRVYAMSTLIIKKAIGEELGIPVMALEIDAYDTRQYSAGQLRARVEAFAELLRTAKATTAAK
jgi:hypothetical protein